MRTYICALPNAKDTIRGLPPHVVSGDRAKLAAFAAKYDKPGWGVFSCGNSLKPGATRRTIENIAAIEEFGVDLDFKDVEETPDEIDKRLLQLPVEPTEARNSGGGRHVIFRLKEPIEAGDTDYFERGCEVLKQLTAALSGDPAPAHPAALLRVVGTHNSKRGDPVLVEALWGSGKAVDITDIEALVESLPPEGMFTRKSRGNGQEGGAFNGAGPVNIEERLTGMRFEGPGDSSIHLTQLQCTRALLHGGVSVQETVALVLEATRKASAGDARAARWNWKSEERAIRRQCTDWVKKNPELAYLMPDSKKPAEAKQAPGWRTHTVSAAALLTMTFPPINYIIPGFVPEGLCILAGRPKVGKSWLALDLCLGVARGAAVLGNIMPVQGDVLYCALEDTNRRLQDRIERLLFPPISKGPERLTLATSWRRLDRGGAADLADWAGTVSEPRLCVLDTLAGVRPERQQKDTTYDGDYKALIDIHRLANERGFALLVLHHTRKMEAEDPLDTISGTLGTVGCADTGIVLARGPQGASLYIRGRDIEEGEHAISFSGETCRWTVLGEAREVRRSDTRKQILAVLEDATNLMSPDEISKLLGIKRNAVDQQLHQMVRAGEVVAISRGRYAHPIKAPKYVKKQLTD